MKWERLLLPMRGEVRELSRPIFFARVGRTRRKGSAGTYITRRVCAGRPIGRREGGSIGLKILLTSPLYCSNLLPHLNGRYR